MPSYTSRSNYPSHLPLTPPDSGSGYAYSDMHYAHDQYMHHQNAHQHHTMNQQPRQDVAYDYSQTYMPTQQVVPAYTQAYQPSMYQSAAGSISSTTLPSISSYYEPIGAPILPPLRMQDRMTFGTEYHPQAQQQQPHRVPAYDYPREAPRQAKEERAVGGVSAKLDYDMDRMTDFVVSTTQHMYDLHCSPICLADIDITRSFQQNISSPPAFRKWVHQVLSATRLPSATILLSLHYLSDRLRLFPASVHASENQIYRLLAVALILGSKFLDDNTFINRSWSDVTAIKVSELNSLEIKWLGLIEYGLHVDKSCVQSWLELWNKYDLEKSREHATVRLSPLDTTVNNRQASSSTRSRYSPYPTPYSSSTMSARTFDSAHTPVSSGYRSAAPYTAVDPWAPTERPPYENYYKRTDGARYPMLSDFDDANNRRLAYEQKRTQPAYPSVYHNYPAAAVSDHMPAWDMHAWYGTHRPDCTCSNCAYRNWKPYTIAGGYSMGTVMG